jgi:probable H4MPT-linked C1 transfer pathway protein
MSWLALDIGGANLKMADGAGFAVATSFPLWLRPDQLGQALQEMFPGAPQAESLAVTMTGELADCFATKREGVEAILDAVEQAAAGRETSVYLVDGRLVAPPVARAEPLLAAASNWHVLAGFARRYCRSGFGLLLDIGSTTCDLIPLGPAGPTATGMTDPERLLAGELVYTGVERSPVCAVVSQFYWRGEPCPVAQEVFATTRDAYLLLDELTADPENRETADGRPSIKACAQARLARSICADTTMFSMADAQQAAAAICEAQLVLLETAASKVCERMTSPPATVVLSGHGEFLGRRLVDRLPWTCRVISLAEQLGPKLSRSACAHALAVLASERAST